MQNLVRPFQPGMPEETISSIGSFKRNRLGFLGEMILVYVINGIQKFVLKIHNVTIESPNNFPGFDTCRQNRNNEIVRVGTKKNHFQDTLQLLLCTTEMP